MYRYFIIATLALSISACGTAPRSDTNNLSLGMSVSEVKEVMGTPDSTAAVKGRGECYYFSLWRDFWNRRPGNYSDRYYTCFQDGKLAYYGRVGDPL